MRIVRHFLAVLALCSVLLPTSPAHAVGITATLSVSGYPTALQVCGTVTSTIGTIDITAALQVEGAYNIGTTSGLPIGTSGGQPIFDAPATTKLSVTSVTLCSTKYNVTNSTGIIHFAINGAATSILGNGAARCDGVSVWLPGGIPFTQTCP